MIESSIFSTFTDIVRNALRDNSIVLTPQTTAQQINGWDSLKQVLIILEVEDRFGIELHSHELDRIRCVGDFVNLIGRKTQAP
jgi:acyl carrier protein